MIKLIKPNEITFDNKYSMLIYGEPGIGKTTTALSASNACLLDFEGGMKRVQPQFWIPSLQVKLFSDVIKLLQSEELNAYNTIVVDPLSSLVDSIICYLLDKFPKLKNGNNLSIRGYGELKTEFNNFWRMLKNKQKNIILVAHEKQETNGENSYMIPDVGSGSSGREIIKHIDLIGRMTHLNGKRAIYFDAANSEFFAKNPFNLPNSMIVDNPMTKNNFIASMVEPAIQKQYDLMKSLRNNYEELSSSIDVKLENIKDVAACNAFYKQVTEDSDLARKGYLWRDKLLEKIKALNLEWDKDKREFVCITQ